MRPSLEFPLRAARPAAAAAALALGRAAAPARADGSPAREPTADAEEQPEREVEVAEVVVVVHYDNQVGTSDAASAGSFTQQLVEDRPLLRPGEVLELVPGLVTTQHSGAGKANQYFLRGFNLDHGTDFLTTVDGVPVNLRTHAHGQGYTDLNFLVPELVTAVDYAKGPYFAAKGDFASAGAADVHYATELPRNLVQATGGSFGYVRALAAGSARLAGGPLLYAVEALHEDGPWVHPDDYRRLNALLRYTHEIGTATLGVTAMAYGGSWNATDQVPLRAVEAGEIDRFGAVDPTDGGRSQRYSLSADWRQPLGGGWLRANAYAVRYHLDLFSNFTYFLQDPVHGDQFEQLDDRWYYGTSGSWSWLGAVAGVTTRARVGWEARQDRIDPVGLYHTAARRRIEGPGTSADGTMRQDDVVETSGAGFAEVDSTWTPWLRTLLGLRYDAYRFEVRSSDPRNSGDAAAGLASPKATLALGPWAETEVFANFGLGFHSNDARGVTTRVDPATGAPVAPVTPLVRTRGGELGVRSEIVPRVQTSLALWRLELDSELVFTGDAGTTEASRPSRRQGVEWSARWQPISWLLFDLDVAWSSARFTDPPSSADHIPGAIATAVSAGAAVHDLGPWSASAFVRYFGPRPLTEDGSVQSTASTIVNAQVGYRIGNRLKLTLDVFNLLDARTDDISYSYCSRLPSDPPPPNATCPVGTKDVHFHPAEPRSFRATAALEF